MTIFKTFKQFLKTGSTVENLHEKCGLFIEQSEGRPLYRGYGTRVSSLFSSGREVPIRKDRRPRDSTQYVHDLMDAYFEEKFGEKIRSSGLFASGNISVARKYGTPHFVLPVGKFKFFWAEFDGKPIKDTLGIARHIENMMITKWDREKHFVTKQIMDEITWRDDDLPRAIESGAEIAFLAESAILIPVGDLNYSKLIAR